MLLESPTKATHGAHAKDTLLESFPAGLIRTQSAAPENTSASRSSTVCGGSCQRSASIFRQQADSHSEDYVAWDSSIQTRESRKPERMRLFGHHLL